MAGQAYVKKRMPKKTRNSKGARKVKPKARKPRAY